jgi:hypothetical protein
MRISPTLRDSLRSLYATEFERLKPKSPEGRERLAHYVLMLLDPFDELDLSKPESADRLREVVNRITNPKLPWTD